MAQYQNFFTQVQVRSTIYPGIPLQPGTWVRSGEGRFNYWLGKLGDALASTIVVLKDDTWKIVREGVIPNSDIAAALT